ncbi:hypothetical protein PR048_033277 [Dryococelus australis]|uniref:Uncharacterized protein n=1 Tax=Dryococelus australis TaxID=614101 RepID=A0ABQ9G413_9NEOP|nr:hypothetical protein PR048_033277 [Dryococelus australis]
MEQCQNSWAGETGDPREKNPLTSGTVPTCENPGVAGPGTKPGSPWWQASSLTAQSPRPYKCSWRKKHVWVAAGTAEERLRVHSEHQSFQINFARATLERDLQSVKGLIRLMRMSDRMSNRLVPFSPMGECCCSLLMLGRCYNYHAPCPRSSLTSRALIDSRDVTSRVTFLTCPLSSCSSHVLCLRSAENSQVEIRSRIRLERASRKQPSDTHKTLYDRVKLCRERKINIKASDRVNVDVCTQNKWPCPQHRQTPFFVIGCPLSASLSWKNNNLPGKTVVNIDVEANAIGLSYCSAPCMRHGPSPLLEVSTGLATTQECSGETGWRLVPSRRITRRPAVFDADRQAESARAKLSVDDDWRLRDDGELDSTVLCTLELQLFVHWLLPQRVASVTPHLAVWDSLLVSLQACYWLRVVQDVSNELPSNCKLNFKVSVGRTELPRVGSRGCGPATNWLRVTLNMLAPLGSHSNCRPGERLRDVVIGKMNAPLET